MDNKNRFLLAFWLVFRLKRYQEYINNVISIKELKAIEETEHRVSKASIQDKFSMLYFGEMRNGLCKNEPNNRRIVIAEIPTINIFANPEDMYPPRRPDKSFEIDFLRCYLKGEHGPFKEYAANVLSRELIDKGYIHCEFNSGGNIVFRINTFV